MVTLKEQVNQLLSEKKQKGQRSVTQPTVTQMQKNRDRRNFETARIPNGKKQVRSVTQPMVTHVQTKFARTIFWHARVSCVDQS